MATDYTAQWGLTKRNPLVAPWDVGTAAPLLHSAAVEGPGFRLETQAGPEGLDGMLLGLACHILVQQLPVSGRLEAFEALAGIREFHLMEPVARSARLAPETMRGVVVGTQVREVPPVE